MITDVADKVKKYKVSIFGEVYTLSSDESEDQVVSAAQLVDSHMRHIAQKNSFSDSKKIAILVALQLANKCISATQEIQNHDEYCQKLVNLVHEEVERLKL